MRHLRVALLMVFLCGLAALACAQGVVKSGDSVQVVCQEEPSLSKTYGITRDGYIVMQYIGAVSIAGLSERDAAAKLEALLIQQRILPKATITLKILGVAKGGLISFSGAVSRSGELFPRPGLRLSDVVNEAKPTAAADLEHVRIVSTDGQVLTVNFSAFDGKDLSKNPEVRAGDKVIFDLLVRSADISVTGLVRRPGIVAFRRGMTLSEAISQAGGLLPGADSKNIRIERESHALPGASIEGPVFVMAPGDSIFVPQLQDQGSVSASGDVNNPTSFGFRPGMTVVDVIRAAGGPKKSADLANVKIHRPNGLKELVLKVDLNKVALGKAPDVPVQNGDRVEVPGRRRSAFDLRRVVGVAAAVLLLGVVKF